MLHKYICYIDYIDTFILAVKFVVSILRYYEYKFTSVISLQVKSMQRYDAICLQH